MTIARADAVVIGAGPNGLAAAITMAEAGADVIMCDGAAEPGGAVRTQELTLPGFRHDTFSAVYPAAAASPVFARWPLSEHGLEWTHPAVALAHPFPDGSAAALYRDVEATVASLEAISKGDGRAWRSFATPLLKAYPSLRRTLIGGWIPVRGTAGLAASLGVHGTLDFARTALLPATQLARELFADSRNQAWLAGSCLHGDVAADESGSAVIGTYLQLLGHAVGWPSPAGGAQQLVESLAGYLASLGGQVRTGAPVERVVTAGGRVAGIELESGDRIRANTVVAAVTPHELLRLAGAALPPGYVRRMARYRYGPGTVKMDWALDGPVPWTAPEARQAGTVHVGGDVEQLVQAQAAVRGGSLPEEPFLLFGQQSVADPTRAPDGKHTAWAYTRVPRDYPLTGDELAAFAARIAAQVERFAPGFAGRVLAQHVMGPADLEARNPSLSQGDVGGGTYALDQMVFRPVAGLTPYRTPAEGLYIGSAATFPGGAVHGAPGHAAGRLAAVEATVRRWW